MLVFAAVLLLGAACGSDDGTTTGRPIDPNAFVPGPSAGWSAGEVKVDPASLKCTDPGGASARGVTDTEIRVGGLVSLTSPGGPALAGADVGAKVRFERANAEGGVQGRKINYVGTKDDGSDPVRNVSQAQALVTQNVFAAVPTMVRSPYYFDTMCGAGVPYFGWGTNPAYCDTAIGFGVTGCLVPEPGAKVDTPVWGMVARAILGETTEGRSAAIVGADQDNARVGVVNMAKSVELAGLSVPYAKNPVPMAGLTDATPIINDLMRADHGAPPDLVVTTLDFVPTTKIADGLTAAGYKGAILTAVGYDPRLKTFPGLQGAYTLLQWAPTQSDSPAIEQLKADFAKYAPEQKIGLTAMAGYWSADFFLDAIEKTGRDLTVDNLLSTLNGGKYTYHVEGALAETQWPVNHTVGAPCATAVRLVDGEYVEALPLSCGDLILTE